MYNMELTGSFFNYQMGVLIDLIGLNNFNDYQSIWC